MGLAVGNDGSYDLLRLANDIPDTDVLLNIYSKYKNFTYTGFLTTVASLVVLAMDFAPGINCILSTRRLCKWIF